MSLSKKSKIIIGVIAFLAIAVTSALLYMYKPHETVDDMKVVYTGSAEELQSVLDEKIELWQKEKSNIVVELTGVITEKGEETISVNESFFFQFPEETNIDALSETQKIKIKGRFIGYDELLEELKFDKAIILKK
ncbi:MAG: hypothetical protein AAF611_13950 [Bacteroidota bacterium]